MDADACSGVADELALRLASVQIVAEEHRLVGAQFGPVGGQSALGGMAVAGLPA